MTTKVLVTDDSPTILAMVKDLLESKGYLVLAAENGEVALELAKSEKPDLALLDTCLPDTNGHDLCRKIKKIKGSKTRVVIYTGQIDAVDAERAMKAGADDYVVKTADFALLLDAIQKLS